MKHHSCEEHVMIHTEILEALRQMSAADRLAIAEAALQMVREELQPPAAQSLDERMRAAAIALLDDYLHDGELTSFTALDGEDFHAEG
jgi:hypothetical protein